MEPKEPIGRKRPKHTDGGRALGGQQVGGGGRRTGSGGQPADGAQEHRNNKLGQYYSL